MVAQENIRRPADLRGKNLGIQEVGAFREVITRAVLQSAGLTAQDVNYVPVSSAGYIAALTTNKIDTAILHIVQAHMARTKKTSLHTFGPLWEVMPSYWYGTFSTTEDLLRKDPDLLGRAVGALMRAHRFMYRNKDRTLELQAKTRGDSTVFVTQLISLSFLSWLWPRSLLQSVQVIKKLLEAVFGEHLHFLRDAGRWSVKRHKKL